MYRCCCVWETKKAGHRSRALLLTETGKLHFPIRRLSSPIDWEATHCLARRGSKAVCTRLTPSGLHGTPQRELERDLQMECLQVSCQSPVNLRLRESPAFQATTSVAVVFVERQQQLDRPTHLTATCHPIPS